MKKVTLGLALFLSFVLCPMNVMAGEVDVLVDLLVEKGILTPIEAQIVVDETKQRVAKEIAQGKSSSLPKWVQNMKVKGDFRLRYQYERDQTDTDARARGRVRYRLGIESKVSDKIMVGFGLASGGTDPRSTNQTFQDTFSSKGINLDYAYAEYKITSSMRLIGGKFKRKKYLWAPTDLLWDSDINPEGGSFSIAGAVVGNLDYWGNVGVWVLDENGNSDKPDPFMNYLQGGLKYKEGMFDAKLAVTGYGFQGIKGITLDHSAGTNTGSSTGLLSTYRSLGVSTEIGFKEIFGGLPFHLDQRIAFFGDFIRNLDNNNIKDNLTGHAFGIKIGNKKVKKTGQWQLKYIKAKLGRDAWLDTFPDSDRLGGKTNVESHEIVLKYALKKNVFFGLDYYKSWSMSNRKDKDNLIQADLMFKF